MSDKFSAYAVSKSLRVSPRKLQLVASLIAKMKVEDAVNQLKFLRKKCAQDVKKCLESAIANAENNFGLDIDNLVISSISVGKSLVMKRFMPRARGRAGKIKKFLSNLYIKVTENRG